MGDIYGLRLVYIFRLLFFKSNFQENIMRYYTEKLCDEEESYYAFWLDNEVMVMLYLRIRSVINCNVALTQYKSVHLSGVYTVYRARHNYHLYSSHNEHRDIGPIVTTHIWTILEIGNINVTIIDYVSEWFRLIQTCLRVIAKFCQWSKIMECVVSM